MFKPRNIDQKRTAALQRLLKKHWPEHAGQFKAYAVNQKRGRAYFSHGGRIFTIPTWAWKYERGRLIQYVAHELAHCVQFCRTGDPREHGETVHGPTFMKTLRELCPPEFQHYELNYKPRLASAAGIRQPIEPEVQL